MSTWLITGCSTGLGRSLAEAVIAAGYNAVVTARDVDKVADLAADKTDRVLALPLDVTDTAQITNAMPSPPIGASPRPDSIPSRLGNTSPQTPTSMPELNDLEVEDASGAAIMRGHRHE
jgi:hypothetical protein